MNSTMNEEIRASLACAHRLKSSVDQTAQEFKHLRKDFLQKLNAVRSERISFGSQCLTTASALHPHADDDTDDDRFLQVSDTLLDEHASMGKPGLVVFGPNSSGKTSFIQHFLGIGSILPSGIGPVTARIVQLTYAAGDEACFRVYETINKTAIKHEEDLSGFFEDPMEPNWVGLAEAIAIHVKRPVGILEDCPDFGEWAQCFVELSIPSNILSLGIDVYDTPGFLSDNREQVLTDNLHKLVKRIKPTLLFLYDNASIGDTDKSCFLAMKNALGSMAYVPVFFLNTKADCISIANDYSLDDDPENVSSELFCDALGKKRQRCYELLLRRREMASEVFGRLPDAVDECTSFDLCTIPDNWDPWEKYTDLINTNSFRRLVQFAVEAYSMWTLALTRDILATVDDYFDLIVSTTTRLPSRWDALRKEALEWGRKFFTEYEQLMPVLVEDLMTNISQLIDDIKPQISRQAALIVRNNDPIDVLLQNNSKRIQDYVRLAVQEQVVKVAANNVIINKREQVKNSIGSHFQSQRGLPKNELLAIAQRQVLSDISPEVLQQTSSFNNFFGNLLKIPMNCTRFFRSLPTRLSAYYEKSYNQFVCKKIESGADDVYNLLDAMDTYATLSNETSRSTFATYCITKAREELGTQKDTFHRNLIAWVEEQKRSFEKNVNSNCQYIKEHASNQEANQKLDAQFSGLFAQIECQLLAATELAKRRGVPLIVENELGRGGFYSVFAAKWGSESNLAVKKLFCPTAENEKMVALEIHYHREITRLCSKSIVPLLFVYENTTNVGQRETWFIMPKYPTTLQDYLKRNTSVITFPRVVSFALTIARALRDLHHFEIAHRDLKSSNIMLDDNEQCFLIDFGTAHFGLCNRTLLGTAPLPPEILAAHVREHSVSPTYDGSAADIYSFGLILYEMLPKPKYDRLYSSTISQLQSLLETNPIPGLNTEAYKDKIKACLASSAGDRPSASDLVIDLERIQQRAEVKPCMMCEDRDRALRFAPCGHKVTCAQCWESWIAAPNGSRQCILCKAIVTRHTQDDANATFFVKKSET